ncbi:MAG: hypothetical protein PWP46_32 [Fusobacteriaceae bacterium]|nr:hypothetical protein [Fusobacteriaceae bacterium]
MKKIIIITLLIILSTLSYSLVIESKAGIAPWNSYNLDGSNYSGTFSLRLEGVMWFEIQDKTELGFGAAFRPLGVVNRDLAQSSNGAMDLITSYPIFASAKYTFPKEIAGITISGRTNLGFSINDVGSYPYLYKTTIGIYSGFGLSGEKDNLNIEILYELTQSNAYFVTENTNFPDENIHITNYLLSLNVGYKLEF